MMIGVGAPETHCTTQRPVSQRALLGAMECEPWDITDDYLSGGGARTYDDSVTYTESSAGQIAHERNHEWRHDLAEVVMSLLQAGLAIESFAELPYMDWPAFPALVPCPQGWCHRGRRGFR